MNFKIIRYEEIDSTNNEAWRLVDAARLDPRSQTVIIAKRQTQGRGQRGHSWQSALGGLYMSVILDPNSDANSNTNLDPDLNLKLDRNLAAKNAYQITLWTAWGIAKALNETGADVKLKWLNDLLIDRRKLGGVLTETRIEANQIRYAVVGIGINWTNPVPDGAIALGELPTTLSNMDELIEVVLSGLKLGQIRSHSEGMGGILTEYLAMLGDRHFSKTMDGRQRQGEVIAIRPTGELVVRWEGNSEDVICQPQNFSVGY